ncbi:hypothetical protein [Phenylobacterium sp.]|uniref:hypothetical protein n=1 Tax=Phenylobacterium sp. TaxID=1871053 RepID=UPI001213E36E|nr:hypothetical protein [Phenylobacterium sp.]THD62039.1 MAG: hypothetical protein E8A49_08810 [Phenylobacterium sp.]
MAAAGLVALVAFGAPSAASAAGLQDENLIIEIPKGFIVGKQGENGPMIGAEYIPQGETVLSWTRMITVQVFRNIKNGDPNGFAEGVKKGWLSACPGSEVIKIKDGVENGYPFAVWQFTCPNNPQTSKPENMYTKLISGTDALYSVQYAYRLPLTKEMILPTMTYLGNVKVCDTRLADRPCAAAFPQPSTAAP